MKLSTRLIFILVSLSQGVAFSSRAFAQEASSEHYGVALQLNRGDPGPLLRGWPWIAVATAAYADESGKPVSLDAAAVRLTVVDASGRSVSWPWQRTGASTGSVTLDAANDVAEVRWILSAEQTTALVDGNYELRFAWGEEQAEPRKIMVQGAPATLSMEQQVQRSRLLAEVTPGPASVDQALRTLDDALAKQPQSVSLWMERATLLKDAGRIDDAAKSVQKAITLFKEQNPRVKQPPVILQRIQREIMQKKIAEVVAKRGSQPTAVASSVPMPATSTSVPSPASAPAVTASVAASIASPAAMSNNELTPAPSASVASLIDERSSTRWVASTELTEAQILAEANGQWAVSARASSEYGKDSYSAAKTTGLPNVRLAGNDAEAWCPAEQNSGTAWLELNFVRSVHATGVRIRQNDNPGAISRVEAIDAVGKVHLWWEGKDPFQPPRVRDIAWFVLHFPQTDYTVAQVKVTLNLTAVPGWKEIDAVQLVGEP